MKRCFIGMRIDALAKESLTAAQEELKKLQPGAARRLRPVPADNFHATIKFLGATADNELPGLVAALAQVASALSPTPATLEGFGAFPSVSRPRAIFAALGQGRGFLVDLTDRVELACAGLNFPKEERARVPHVTVARVEQARVRGPLTDWLHAAPVTLLGHVDTTTLVLYESQRGEPHSRYVPLAELTLGRSPS